MKLHSFFAALLCLVPFVFVSYLIQDNKIIASIILGAGLLICPLIAVRPIKQK